MKVSAKNNKEQRRRWRNRS